MLYANYKRTVGAFHKHRTATVKERLASFRNPIGTPTVKEGSTRP